MYLEHVCPFVSLLLLLNACKERYNHRDAQTCLPNLLNGSSAWHVLNVKHSDHEYKLRFCWCYLGTSDIHVAPCITLFAFVSTYLPYQSECYFALSFHWRQVVSKIYTFLTFDKFVFSFEFFRLPSTVLFQRVSYNFTFCLLHHLL